MPPLHPPFPTASNFIFQFVDGSHTSILMSESFDGFSVAATRQNSGRLRNALAGPPPAPRAPGTAGSVNAPAATGSASVMVVFGSFKPVRLSQVAAFATWTAKAMITRVRKAFICDLQSRNFGLLTDEIRCVVRVSRAFVRRGLRIRTKRTCAVHLSTCLMCSRNGLRRLLVFDPLRKG